MKFFISETSARLIRSRLSAVLPYDGYAKADGKYHIRSLYFDDALFRSYYDKEAGVSERKKYRIRYYNDDPGFIRLEEKEKKGNVCFKTSVRISRETAESFLTGNSSPGPLENTLLEDFSRRVRTGAFSPVLFTDYTRTSFCHPLGNLRIALDEGVLASRFNGSLWKTGVPIPVLKSNESILEIKYSSFFPLHIMRLLDDIPRVQSAVSKYCMCCEALY